MVPELTELMTSTSAYLKQLISVNSFAYPPTGTLFDSELTELNIIISKLQSEQQQLRNELQQHVDNLHTLAKREHLYKEVFDRAVTGILIVAKDGPILNANDAIGALLGYRKEELIELSLNSITLPEDHDADAELINDLFEGRRTYYNIEKRYIRNDGILLWMLLTAFPVSDVPGRATIILMLEDISARKSNELHLQYISSHDSLTGLYNRAFFDSEMIRLQLGLQMPVSIIVVDVDGLKLLNDSKGHEAGDALIIGVAMILQEAFQGDTVVARTGGDEFVVLLVETDEKASLDALERLRTCQYRHNGVRPSKQVQFSVGVATAHLGRELTDTFKRADEQMYAEKVMRKAQVKQSP